MSFATSQFSAVRRFSSISNFLCVFSNSGSLLRAKVKMLNTCSHPKCLLGMIPQFSKNSLRPHSRILTIQISKLDINSFFCSRRHEGEESRLSKNLISTCTRGHNGSGAVSQLGKAASEKSLPLRQVTAKTHFQWRPGDDKRK